MVMGAQISVDSKALQKRLAEMEARARDLLPVMEVAAQDIEAIYKDATRGAKSPNGTAWKPLAESTIERRSRVGKKKKGGRGNLKPLRGDSASLIETLFSQPTPDRRGVEFGSGALSRKGFPYWLAHQLGGKRNGREAPPRRAFMPVDSPALGQLAPMKSGPGARFFARLKKALAAYLSGDDKWQL